MQLSARLSGLLGTLGACLVVLSTMGVTYSDGFAGGSGAIPERYRECNGVEFCKFRPSLCGTCHGQSDDMWRQEGANPTPQERVRTTFQVDNDDQAGTRNGQWEYSANQQYTITITLEDGPGERTCGPYACGGFNLNASAGTLSKVNDGDAAVRITSPGSYAHAGSESPGQDYGSVVVDESAWAGEATHTQAGNDQLSWQLKWTSPANPSEPRGVAFVLTGMLADGNGVASCANRNCNASQGYAEQKDWDWYSFMIPRRLMCEQGAHDDFAACEKAVYDFILPPAPPLNSASATSPTYDRATSAATNHTSAGSVTAPRSSTATSADGADGSERPVYTVAAAGMVGTLAALFAAVLRRRPPA